MNAKMLKTVLKTFFGKGTLLVIALFYAMMVMIGSTFSWVTSSSQKENTFTGEIELTAVIVEDFDQQNHWQPGTDLTKTVSVHNDGKSAGFVRISFEEITRLIKTSDVSEPFVDADEPGVTPEYCLPSKWDTWKDADSVFDSVVFLEDSEPVDVEPGIIVKVKKSMAGIHRYQYAIYQEVDGGQAYRRMTAQFSADSDTLAVHNPRYWGYQDIGITVEAAWGLANETSTIPMPLSAADISHLCTDDGKKITINYTHLITALTSKAADEGKWFYNESDGFFYYIGKIEPNVFSNTLMTGLTLAADADISYSLMNLQLIINMQALQVNADALASEWGLDGQLYAILSSFC
jgi:hypothetical protein